LVHGVTVTGGAGGNELQGSSGELTPTTAAPTAGFVQAYIGGIHADDINAGPSGGDFIFGMGGDDTIALGTGHGGIDTIGVALYHEGGSGSSGSTFVQAITDIVNLGEIGVNGYLGALSQITTVSGFNLGPSGDVLDFSVSSWARGAIAGAGGFDFGLENNSGTGHPAPGPATMQLISTPGAATNGSDITLDNIATYADAAHLQTALTTATVGNIVLFPANLTPHFLYHILVAYGTGTGVNIADVEIFNNTGTGQSQDTSNPGLTVIAHDLVDLVGTASLGNMNPHNIQFV
jgi:hypothetical protein